MAENNFHDGLTVSSSPHLVTALDTQKTMLHVLTALIPSAVMSAVFWGVYPVCLILGCMAFSALSEYLYDRIMKLPNTTKDCSALVTGAILALTLPPSLPIWMAFIGCAVSIIIVKCLYGGLGRNIANPAIVGRIVLLLSFTTQMTTWKYTGFQRAAGVDGMTGATPLGQLFDGAFSSTPGLTELLLGNRGGSLGETCIIAILAGGIFLIVTKIISPVIPLVYLGTLFVFAFIYYLIVPEEGADAFYMAVFHLLSGGAVFGAFFCATDYVTSPVLKKGKIIYAAGCGFFTMVIRLFCSYPEGASFAILFMNIMTPLIDKYTIDGFYGISRRAKEEKKKAKEETGNG
ncbi:MAG: RnfABCDGE type electron transport complex subunit D [Lachnospiraceae bacterium]|nr:RnfABCDGE type electron transport complex subunit D [Lachnospiraceae bacterium]